jgi:hypothetical protein
VLASRNSSTWSNVSKLSLLAADKKLMLADVTGELVMLMRAMGSVQCALDD